MPFPETFDAYLPSNGKGLFEPPKIRPDYVSFETLRAVPLEPSAHCVPRVRPGNHAARGLHPLHPGATTLPSRSCTTASPRRRPASPRSPSPSSPGGSTHTCILHDLGWAAPAHPAAGMSFELQGGIMAFEHLRAAAPDLDAQQVGDIVQSIVLHTSEWPSGTSSATKTLISLGALFDVGGYDAHGPGSLDFLINRKTVQEIEKEYPRGDFAAEAVAVLHNEFKLKPDCLLSHFGPGSDVFLNAVRKDPIVPVDE
ncbi:hypothetical protein K438DRAFT_1786141 [Mycena galopus ATCC 62051]|nr:hypothetical protein K438DRAFT_1786141 [Mycena galopus ATCC 62051]